MNLYELNAAIEACIDEETGEVLVDELEELAIERDTKIENIACWIKNLAAESAALKAEEERLNKRRKTADNRILRLKEYLGATMGPDEKMKTARVVIGHHKSEGLVIADGTDLPEEFLKYEAPKPMKAEIKKALKAGREIDGCSLVQNISITIR